jgi:hypothetical protein
LDHSLKCQQKGWGFFAQAIFLAGTVNLFAVVNAKNHTVHCKPSPFDKQFCMANTSVFISYITFKVIKRKYFSQGKCEFLIFLFVLLDKIKMFTLETVYLPHQLLYMLFLAPLKNV